MSNGKGVDAATLSPRIVPVVRREVGFSLVGVWNGGAGVGGSRVDGLAERAANPPLTRINLAHFAQSWIDCSNAP